MGEIAAGITAISEGRYPLSPGYRELTTSLDAAKAIHNHAQTLKDRILALLGGYPAGLTPDEAADLLNETVLGCRPRLTELKILGKIVATGERRKNKSGLMAKVWKLAPQNPLPL